MEKASRYLFWQRHRKFYAARLFVSIFRRNLPERHSCSCVAIEMTKRDMTQAGDDVCRSTLRMGLRVNARNGSP